MCILYTTEFLLTYMCILYTTEFLLTYMCILYTTEFLLIPLQLKTLPYSVLHTLTIKLTKIFYDLLNRWFFFQLFNWFHLFSSDKNIPKVAGHGSEQIKKRTFWKGLWRVSAIFIDFLNRIILLKVVQNLKSCFFCLSISGLPYTMHMVWLMEKNLLKH